MATHRVSTGDVAEMNDSNIGTTSGSDAQSASEKKGLEVNEKAGSLVHEDEKNGGFAGYEDVEPGEDIIHHPAEKDDILTHTIHVEDDPTLNALTFRTFFLGMSRLICLSRRHITPNGTLYNPRSHCN